MLRIHNAMWPGVVGKGENAAEPTISLKSMLERTINARVNGQGFDGIDLNLMEPHIRVDASKNDILNFADQVAELGLNIGSLGAPVWANAGGGSAMGSDDERKHFLEMIKKTCEFAQVLNDHGVRKYGIIRIDSADSPVNWASSPATNTSKIADTFREAAVIASHYGERLAAEGEICWAAMHSWRNMLNLLEEVDMPGTLGFQADFAHTYLYMLGYNAPEHALVSKDHNEEEFWNAYKIMTDALGPWTIDVHVAQSNGSVFGSGNHDKTGRHCTADAPDGKIDMVRCAGYWLLDDQDNIRNNIRHICWDGCMFPNEVLESAHTWNTILRVMLNVREAYNR